ncbi:MAG: hypothetical protein BGO69_11455 [Bacteroidetes bacterium 46-16]|nr:MAG: hypothetical protein BGO69_11455 [Bacteroidetes bacterium 46-16]
MTVAMATGIPTEFIITMAIMDVITIARNAIITNTDQMVTAMGIMAPAIIAAITADKVFLCA